MDLSKFDGLHAVLFQKIKYKKLIYQTNSKKKNSKHCELSIYWCAKSMYTKIRNCTTTNNMWTKFVRHQTNARHHCLTTSVSMSFSTSWTVRKCGTPVTGHGTSSVRVVIFSPRIVSVSRTINAPAFVLIAMRGKTRACEKCSINGFTEFFKSMDLMSSFQLGCSVGAVHLNPSWCCNAV